MRIPSCLLMPILISVTALASCGGGSSSSQSTTPAIHALTITASSGLLEYGGFVSTVTPIFSGFVNGDTVASLSVQPKCSTTATTSSPVGSYSSSCSGAVDSNYAISYVAGTVTINPAPLTITATSPSTSIGSVPPVFPIFSGFVNGDTVASLSVQPKCSTTATTSSPVGSYSSSCSGAVDSNYAISYVAGTVTINPAPPVITVQPTPESAVPGQTATFTVTVTSQVSVSYQWSKNGVPINGAVASSYTTPPAALQDDGSTFTVAVTNTGGTTVSKSALLSVAGSITPTPTTYKSSLGVTFNLFAWSGAKVAVLTSSQNLDPVIMHKMLNALDAAWTYYQTTTGKSPTIFLNYNGLDLIAEVPTTADSSCGGAACSYIGFTGTEIASPYLQVLYTDIQQSNIYDQVLFYEFGRNFWFYSAQLGYQAPADSDCVVTGYAVLMRYMSLQGAGLLGSYDGYKGLNGNAGYNQIFSDTGAIVDTYVANASLTWANTLEIGQSPALGCTDMFASFVLRLRQNYGGEPFLQQIWKEAAKRPTASDTQTAVDNFVLSASAAAGKNLTALFGTTWRWPVSAAAMQEALTKWGPPV